MKNRQAKSGNRLPPTLARPDRASLPAPAVTTVLEEAGLLPVVLVNTVELDPDPALAPVVGLGEPVPELDSKPDEAVPEPVADGVEVGDCLELADVADVAAALESLDAVLPEVAVAELEAEVGVDEPLLLSLVLPALEDVSVADTEAVVLSEADDGAELEVTEEELSSMTDPLVGLVC